MAVTMKCCHLGLMQCSLLEICKYFSRIYCICTLGED